jgi:hypothetical protein
LNRAVPQALSLGRQCCVLLSLVVQSIIKRQAALTPASIILLFVRRRTRHIECFTIYRF